MQNTATFEGWTPIHTHTHYHIQSSNQRPTNAPSIRQKHKPLFHFLNMFIANNTMPISQDHCKWQKEKDPIEKQQFCVTSADLQVICKSMKINSLGFRTVWLYSGHDDESWASSHEQWGEDISEKTKGQSLTCQEREQEKRGERERERERNQIYIFVFNLLYTLRWSHGTTLWKASCTAGKINKKMTAIACQEKKLKGH